ncbi:MAG TPA: PfkB family carbohydrate kinase [Phycisphaerae bacterium]|nr:PfkB family carbohydrate kinase [Phycisphaerae bacterium]
MPNVICLGELLIDFPAGERDASLAEAVTFAKAPGGAPANVAVGLVRLGVSAGFIGAVGRDPFGEFLEGVLRREGVDAAHLAKIDGARTTLAFIAARSDGRKDILFYRNPGADMMLAPEHVSDEYVRSAECLHYGSISRIDEGPRAATDKARRIAAEAGLLVSYDPNWRPTLWPDRDEARRRVLEGFDGATLAKVSEEEWSFITGAEDFAAGAKGILDRGVELVVRSEGPHGASFATVGASGHVDGFAVNCVEPTGAGDGFAACLIVELLAHWRQGRRPGELDIEELHRIVRRANAAGALACTQVGAMPSLPTAGELDEFLRRQAS